MVRSVALKNEQFPMQATAGVWHLADLPVWRYIRVDLGLHIVSMSYSGLDKAGGHRYSDTGNEETR